MVELKFAMYLQEKMEQNGVGSRELSERLRVSESSVIKWQEGKSIPDITTMKRISKEIGVSTIELIKMQDIGDEERYNKVEIDDILEGALSRQLSKNKMSRGERVVLIFSLLAVVFIGFGVISLMAYNWEFFTREIKSVIALIPLLGLQIAYYSKKDSSYVWRKSLELGLGIAFMVGLSLMCQAYQLSIDIGFITGLTFAFMLPIVYVVNGYYLSVFILAGMLVSGFITGGILTLTPILLIPYFLRVYKEKENYKTLMLIMVMWVITLPMTLLSSFEGISATVMLLFAIASQVIERGYSTKARRFLYIMAFIIMMIGNTAHMDCTVIDMIAIGITLVVMSLSFRAYDTREKLIDFIFTGMLFLITTFFMYSRDDVIVTILFNLYIIALSVIKLRIGIAEENDGSTRRYIFALNLYVLAKVMTADVDLVGKGIGLIVIGAGFLMANYMYTKKKGAKSDELEQE